MLKKIIFLLLGATISFAQNGLSILPKPQNIVIGKGNFIINKLTKIVPLGGITTSINPIATELSNELNKIIGSKIEIVSRATANKIEFILDKNIKIEGYKLIIKPTNVQIIASSEVGLFYGYQTLLQILPVEIYGNKKLSLASVSLPVCEITDSPRFGYRGLMLDVSRHFYSTEFVKHIIDLMAMHKMNTFHWHLTDDQGWRIEIKKYPLLTEVGSKRKETMLGYYSDNKYDGTPYGGFYTQEEIKDVVKYAQSKFVTIVPEIEMPGHALAALASYPELGCTGEKFEVGTKWGVEERVYCPTDKTFEFLENVLTEVMDLFPGQYIHIGGDECPKKAWKESKFCQDLMKKEGLKDEHELQSYFISKIDKFVSSKGRKIIGWDEILEGGLSPNATVMSWRGESGGIEAAKQKHDVIMTPNGYLYLDYYQADSKTEPLAIGGFLPLEKVYSYEPYSTQLTEDERKYIKGVQANLWTEYIASPQQAEYMLFPRVLAAAEIGWSNESKNYDDFVKRVNYDFKRLYQLNVNYSKAVNYINFTTTTDKAGVPIVVLTSKNPENTIRYTLDGSVPTEKSAIYKNAQNIIADGEFTIFATGYDKSNKQDLPAISKTYIFSKSTGKKYNLTNAAEKYFGEQNFALTDGLRGNEMTFLDWVGFKAQNFVCTLDLGQKFNFENVSIGFLNSPRSYVLSPKKITISVSNDNQNFVDVKEMELSNTISNEKFVQQLNIAVGTQNARYVKIFAENGGILPAYVSKNKELSWLFVDEISIK